MTPRNDAAGREPMPVDESVFSNALHEAAARCVRLSDEQVRALRRRRRGVAAGGGTILAVAALLLMTREGPSPTPVAPGSWARTLATRAGEKAAVTLADGSSVRLDGATRVRIVYSAGGRSARLLAGQAFFDVRHDPSRPFVVHAGGADARVLGTAFDLGMTRRQVSLAVYRGAVGFDPAGSPRGVVVPAGYRSNMRNGVPERPVRFDPSLPDWREGWIDTAGMRLDDLVEVLRREGDTRVVMPGEPLASMQVFGRFRTDRPQQLLRAIGAELGFRVVEEPDGITLKPMR
ncbi:FecR domain-containing protein [Sphingomonadaceae bacterium jetA1]|jgi:transmembrane sensor|uniref:FecR family protein n=1 Tax=Facivitalis istanbulensis TaxID=3075838 RepID=UPI003475EBF9